MYTFLNLRQTLDKQIFVLRSNEIYHSVNVISKPDSLKHISILKRKVITVISLIHPSIIFDIKFSTNTGLANQMFEDL